MVAGLAFGSRGNATADWLIAYHHAGRGVFRYRFDLRKATQGYAHRQVQVVWAPLGGAGTVLLRRFELLDERREPLDMLLPGASTSDAQRVTGSR